MNVKYLLPAILATILVIYKSSTPGFSIPGVDDSIDQIISNLAHIPAFAVITFLWLGAFRVGRYKRTTIAVIIGSIFILACISEYIQWYVPGRYATGWDIILNLIGIAIACLFFWLISQRRSHGVARS